MPKSVTLTGLAEVGGPAFAARYAKAKKAELAQSCERIFAGDFIGEVEVKEAALAWIPDVMKFRAAEAEPANDVAPEDERPPWEEDETQQPMSGLDDEAASAPSSAEDRRASVADEPPESGACGGEEGIEQAA